MHVRKFYGETIEETLKKIKTELGPDTIILKTVSNKGIKGALKKHKIEITAAISEKDYVKKATLENALDTESREKLYENKSSYVSELIDGYDNKNNQTLGGYGNISLNRPVQKNEPQKSNKLDSFLAEEKEVIARVEKKVEEPKVVTVLPDSDLQESVDKLNSELIILKNLVSELQEEKTEKVETEIDLENPYKWIAPVQQVLRNSGISEEVIFMKTQEYLHAKSEYSTDDYIQWLVDDFEKLIKISEINFQKIPPYLNVFLGAGSSGQSTLMRKIMMENSNCVLVTYKSNEGTLVSDTIANLEVINVNTPVELFQEARKRLAEGKHCLVDVNLDQLTQDEVISLLEFAKNNFDNYRTMMTMSAIQIESLGRKNLLKYKKYVETINITNTDKTSELGFIINILSSFEDLNLSYLSSSSDISTGQLGLITSEVVLDKIFV